MSEQAISMPYAVNKKTTNIVIEHMRIGIAFLLVGNIDQDNNKIQSRRLLIATTKLHSLWGRPVVDSLLFWLSDFGIDLYDESRAYSLNELRVGICKLLEEAVAGLIVRRLQKELAIMDSIGG